MRKQIAAVAFGAAAVAAVACQDVVQPQVAREPSLARSGGTQAPTLLTTLIAPVERATALPADVTWSFVAGPNGFISSDAATGLTVSVPAGALADDVIITVTALAGTSVAYRFEPHGLQFGSSVLLTQDLTLTTVNLLSGLTLSGAYFTSDTLEFSAGGLAIVTEVIGALANPLTGRASFPIRHFSGYILASGRDDSTSTDGGQ